MVDFGLRLISGGRAGSFSAGVRPEACWPRQVPEWYQNRLGIGRLGPTLGADRAPESRGFRQACCCYQNIGIEGGRKESLGQDLQRRGGYQERLDDRHDFTDQRSCLALNPKVVLGSG